MTFSVNTNAEAMTAIRLLSQTNKILSTVQEHVNSGFRINSFKDNASTFAIAQGMRADVGVFKAITDSLSMGSAVANTALKAGEDILEKLKTLQAEVAKANDPTANREMVQNAIDSYLTQLDNIVNAAQFNGHNLLDGVDSDLSVLSSWNRSDPTTVALATISVQAEDLTTATLGVSGLNVEDGYSTLTFGPNWATSLADNDTISLTVGATTYTFEFIDDLTSTATTVAENIAVDYDPAASPGANIKALTDKMAEYGFTAKYDSLGGVQISHGDGAVTGASSNGDVAAVDTAASDPATALQTVETAMNTVKAALSRIGASANAIDYQKDFVMALRDQLTQGVGELVDADLAEESASLQALQTRQQLGLQALSIANQAPSAVLALFR